MPNTLNPVVQVGRRLAFARTKSIPTDNEPLRVLCVIPGTESNGQSTPFARRQVETLAEQNLTIKPFYLGERRSLRGLFREWLRFRETLRAWEPDLVHVHFGGIPGGFSAFGCGYPLVITFHGSDLNPAPGDGRLMSFVRRIISQVSAVRAREIICVSRQLRGRLWWRRQRIQVIPCGVGMDTFRPLDQSEARKRLGWTGDEPVAIVNVRDDPVGKRLDLAVAAMDWVRERLPAARLEVLRGKVPFAEMPLYYAAADCLLMTSDFEGSPTVVKEALACNLPVVSVDVGDVSERLAGVTPSAMVARQPAEIGQAALAILRSRTRSNGRMTAASLDEQVISQQIAAVYRRVVKSQQGAVEFTKSDLAAVDRCH